MIYTKEMISQLCEQNNYQNFVLRMTNGDQLTITPCLSTNTHCMQDIEWWLVRAPIPFLDAATIEELINTLNHYETIVVNHANQKAQLKTFYLTNIYNKCASPEIQDYYSDWHKDIFGFRPKYNCFGISRHQAN